MSDSVGTPTTSTLSSSYFSLSSCISDYSPRNSFLSLIAAPSHFSAWPAISYLNLLDHWPPSYASMLTLSSTDRVFVHALNTVKKIPRTGSARPPSSDRLKLYGLYKQSMEGDVAGVMERPEGEGEGGERDKWDAWSAQAGLSRTEAKRRYISTLITTMHTYASSTPEARELVAELEFVWDQIKANEASSGSDEHHSSPGQRMSSSGRVQGGGDARDRQRRRLGSSTDENGLRVLRPFSDEDGDEDGDEEDEDGEGEGEDGRGGASYANLEDPGGFNSRSEYEVRNRKWRRRMERALVRMTAEVAALRELVEARRGWGIARGRRKGTWGWVVWFLGAMVRHVLVDAAVVALALLWRWGRGDRRLMALVGAWLERIREIRVARVGKGERR